jgi:photosystem II stability/assembly factor-like uncharacterized protein
MKLRARRQGWYPLKLGAGGFVINMDIASDGSLYAIGTDVFGGYVSNSPTTDKWQQLCTSARMSGFTAPASAINGAYIDGLYDIRIAPSNSSILYMVFAGWVWRSNNRGATWEKTAFTQSTNLAANSGGTGGAFGDRYNGRKLAIDPVNPDVVYFGTKSAGVYYTRNGGASWTQIATGTIPHATGNYSHKVVVDPSSSTTSGRKSVVYATSDGNGLYKSTDGGDSWSLMNGSGYPTAIVNVKVASDGTVFCSTTGGAIKKLSGSTWTDISPNTQSGRWRNMVIHPSDPNFVIAIRDGGEIRVSSNGGTSYSAMPTKTRTATDIPWLAWTDEDYMSDADMVWDPVNTTRLWFAMGIGVFYADNITTSTTNVAWQSASADVEELVVNQIHKPAGQNKIYAACWDRPLFQTNAPDTYPSTHGPTFNFGWGWSIDSAIDDPNFMVLLANKNSNPVENTSKSTDGGATWTAMPNFGPAWGYSNGNFYGGHIAVSTSSNFIWCPNSGAHGSGAYYTTDGGTTWTECSLPDSPGSTGWGQGSFCKRRCVDSDKVTANKFYLYNSVKGLYRTTDGGANWTQVISNPNLGALASAATSYHAKLRAVPGQAGHLFFTSGADGQTPAFVRSTDSGSTWSAVSNVTDVFAFGFGKIASGQSYPAVFIAGKVSGVWGMWRSDDNCSTWVNLGTFPRNHFDFVSSVEGDMDIYGRCYVGFSGSGAMYYVV